MSDRISTRSSTRSRLRKPASVSSGIQRSSNLASTKTNAPGVKQVAGPSRQKPIERASSSSRLTRSTTKTTDPKKREQRVDEGSRRNRMISVGEKFQASVPPFDSSCVKPSLSPERGTCVWAASEEQNDERVEKFCIKVFEKLGLNAERAMYHLYRNDFDYEKAMASAANSVDLGDKWSEDDKYCFYGLFSTFGRDFQKIHQIMSHKSMRSIIDYYYKAKLQCNYASIVDRDALGFDLSRKSSTEEREPDVIKPSVCQNCGTRALLYQTNNLRQCLSCKKYFEEFNSNRPMGRQLKPLNLTFEDDVLSMVHDFKEMCEPQPETLKSKCEEIKQNAITHCKLLRSEALRKDANSNRIAQKMISEVNLDEYKKLLTAGNASSARSRITNVWTNNEKNVAVQALLRYEGDCMAAASILGTKTSDMVNEFYAKYEQILNDAIKVKPNTSTSKRREQADQQYNKMISELEKGAEVVELE